MSSAPERYAFPQASATAATPPMLQEHFSVAQHEPGAQALAWRDHVGRILDSHITRSQVAHGFRGEIDAYVLPDMVYLDSRTDPLIQARTGARISTDTMRDFVFHVAVQGMMETRVDRDMHRGGAAQFGPGILALDMAQPMRMLRPTRARVLAFFVPRSLVEAEITDAAAIHGCVIGYSSPLTRLILDQLLVLCHSLPSLSANDAAHTIRSCCHLIIAAFNKRQVLGERARAAGRAALQNQVHRFILANLHSPDLSPQTVLQRFALPRPTMYRMFESEGGLATYIRHRRLWEAATELVQRPDMAVVEVGYGLGFNSAPDFARAFRRAFGVPPREFRALGLSLA